MKAEITKLPNITTNGLLGTSNGDGTLGIFTEGEEFDLLQRDGTNFKAVRESVPLKRTQIFNSSFLNAYIPIQKSVFAWDTFNRANTTNLLGISDSNNTWTNFIGEMKISSNSANSTTNTLGSASIDLPVFPNTGLAFARNSLLLGVHGITRQFNNRIHTFFIKDLNNYIEVYYDGLVLIIDVVISNVRTNVFNVNSFMGDNFLPGGLATMPGSGNMWTSVLLQYEVSLVRYQVTTAIGLGLCFNDKLKNRVKVIDLSMYINDFGLVDSITKVGIGNTRSDLSSRITGFYAMNLGL